MKWFKHISDSLDDPFIFDLLNKFGAEGYLVFFGILEIYSREFKTELDWKLSVTRDYLRQKLCKRQDTLIINSLEHIKKSGKWEVEFKDNQVVIFIPKFTELLDDWSQRKLRSNSVVTPKILKPIKIKDKRVKIKYNNRGIFQIPSLLEISTFCKQRNNQVNAETFFSYYQSNGWMVGKNKMKDWKSAIVTWEKNSFNTGGNNGTSTYRKNNNNRELDQGTAVEIDRIAKELRELETK
jgi:hypothetical protein